MTLQTTMDWHLEAVKCKNVITLAAWRKRNLPNTMTGTSSSLHILSDADWIGAKCNKYVYFRIYLESLRENKNSDYMKVVKKLNVYHSKKIWRNTVKEF